MAPAVQILEFPRFQSALRILIASTPMTSPSNSQKPNWARPSDWPFIWKFLVPSLVAMALIAVLAVAATLALHSQTKRMDAVVNGAMENALFLGEVRAELRGDARDLYNALAARAGGDTTTGSAAYAAKIAERLKLLQDRVKARADKATDAEDKAAYAELIKEIEGQKGAVEFVSSMLEIDLNAAISFVGPYAASEQNTDAIVQKVLKRTDARAKAMAAESVKGAQRDTTLIVIIAAIAALGAGALGIFIGRSTTRSINGIADATRRLAAADMTVDPRSLHRGDELGQVVEALQVFKDVTGQSRALSAEQEEAGRARLERAAEMESLIGAFNRDFSGLIRSVEKASSHLEQSAAILTSTSSENASRAHSAVNSIFSVRDSMSTVAAASEELGATISEVDRQAAASADVARDATERAQHTQSAVGELTNAVARINEIVDLISSVAKQTNLLALNATIEAARAGDAGRGFAVVAHEVKSLADQTSKATEEIRNRIGDVRRAADRTTSEIGNIADVIVQMQGISENTSESVRQQVQATREITQSLSTALQGAGEASATIEQLNQSAEEAGVVSGAVTEASHSLSQQADQMKDVVETFLKRAATM